MYKKVGTTHAVSCATTMLYETVSETSHLLQEGRSCVFATNKHFKWNLGVRLESKLKSQSEVWKGKNSPGLDKFWRQASKVKPTMIMAYDYTGIIATYVVPHGCTVDQHVYIHILRKILRPKVQQMC